MARDLLSLHGSEEGECNQTEKFSLTKIQTERKILKQERAVEDKRLEKNATRAKLCYNKKKVKWENKGDNRTPEELEKEQQKKNKSGSRSKDKLLLDIKLKKVSEDYGEYFMIKNAIPYHVMTRLICGFKTREFNLKYVKEFSHIKAGNRDVNKKDSLAKDHSTYWLMNQKGSFVVTGGWDKQND